MNLYGGIEAGGTKFVCGVGSGKGELIVTETIDTTTPEETIGKVIEFFTENKVKTIGIGSFGPLNLDKTSKDYGSIVNTVKTGWQDVNIYRELQDKLGVKTAIVTDTDSAAIGEQFFGKGVGVKNLVYLTVGTGIGGTVIVNNDIVHGVSHPEMGHIIIPADGEDMRISGGCTYHDYCLENLASGKSMELRYGSKPAEIKDPKIWDLEAKRLAYGIVNIISFIQPQIIIIGGGVIKTPGLLNRTNAWVLKLINGYYNIPKIEEYIINASSDTIGVLGAIKLAEQINNTN